MDKKGVYPVKSKGSTLIWARSYDQYLVYETAQYHLKNGIFTPYYESKVPRIRRMHETLYERVNKEQP